MNVRDNTHMTSVKIVQFLRAPISLVHLRLKFSQRLDPGHPVPSKLSPFSRNYIQSIKRKHNPKDDYYMLSGPSFRLAFVFSINSLILPAFPLTSFHLASFLFAFSGLYILVCAVIYKYHEMSFIYNYSHL